MLHTDRDRDSKAIHQTTEGRSVFMHVYEYRGQRSILVLAVVQVDLVIADLGFLRVTGPAIGQPATFGQIAMNHALGNSDWFGLVGYVLGKIVFQIRHRIERLTELGSVPIKCV